MHQIAHEIFKNLKT